MPITKSAAVLISILAATFWLYSRQPLSHTDLWGHLSYGRWIAEHGQLPAADPFMPLARGVAVVDTAWLTQLLAYGVEAVGGLAGLQFSYALAVAGCCGLLVGGMFRKTGRLAPAILVWGAFLALEWFQLRVIRPQIAGLAGFICVKVLLDTSGDRRIVRGIPALLVVWANAHGSFVTGLGLLALCTVGTAIDLTCRRDGQAAFQNRTCRTWAAVTVVSGLAVLINPYGFRLYAEVLTFARNPNLRDLIEWAPLHFGTVQGQLFAVMCVLLVAATFLSRRNWTAFDWLPLGVFGVATLCSARMIVWWGPLAAWHLAEQLDAACGRWRGRSGANSGRDSLKGGVSNAIEPCGGPAESARASRSPGASGVWSAMAAAAVCAAVVASPLVTGVLCGDPRNAAASVSSATPVAAVEWLRSNPPKGLLFSPSEWGDYLVWAGPQGVAAFVTSQVHLIPPDVWRDYRAISRGDPDSLDRLELYRVSAALIDRRKQSRLADRLSADSGWRPEYVDDQAMIFVRRAQ